MMTVHRSLLGLLLVGLAACSEPDPAHDSSNDGSEQLSSEREFAEMFDLTEEGAPEIVAFLQWAHSAGPDTGQKRALLDLPPTVVYARLKTAYEGAINDLEHSDLLYVASHVIAPEMLPLFEEVLESPVPPEIFEIDPHDGRLMAQLGVYSSAVIGVWELYEGGAAEGRPLLLLSASHPLVTVRGITASLVAQGTDEDLIEEVRALLPEEEKSWL